MDDETIDNIFQGVLEDLPRPTSKVHLYVGRVDIGRVRHHRFVFIEIRLHFSLVSLFSSFCKDGEIVFLSLFKIERFRPQYWPLIDWYWSRDYNTDLWFVNTHYVTSDWITLQVVRIFTSSTFTDMTMERNTLMQFVYPKLKTYCREKHGLEFQVTNNSHL